MADRCADLWKRFAGMFGGEALARKFGDKPPQEWVSTINRLTDFELERGMRRLVASGKSYVPSLPEFRKLCKEVANDEIDQTGYRAPLLIESQPQPRWDREANDHLLGYVTRQARAGIHYCDLDASKHWLRRGLNPDELSAALTQPLVEAKNAWAQDMRDAESAGQLPDDGGKKWWAEYMQAAEGAVAMVRAGKAA